MPLPDDQESSALTEQSDQDDKVCRDFLRNVCHRGAKCRFRHPESEELEALGGSRPDSLFCHDFQNKTCARKNCKFIHCTREEQIHFANTGELPLHVLDVLIERGLVSEVLFNRLSGPLCKDFLKGECKRGGKCKFRHVTRADLRDMFGVKPLHVPQQQMRHRDGGCCDFVDHRRLGCKAKGHYSSFADGEGPCMSGMRNNYRSLDGGWMPPGGPTEPKRCHLDPSGCHGSSHGSNGSSSFVATVRSLEEENAILTKKVERLEREVSDLKATNEFLLDQNAQLRYCNGRVTTVNSLNTVSVTGVAATATPVASVSVPAIAQISQPGATAVVAAAAPTAIAPVTISVSQPLTATQGMPTTAIPISISSAVNAIQGPVVSAGTTALVTYPAVMTQNIRTNGIIPT